jgi:hypothetical protein
MKPQKFDLILVPRIEQKWVHFDRWYFVNGKYAKHEHARNNWEETSLFSFKYIDVIKYILSDNKKEERIHSNIFDGEISILSQMLPIYGRRPDYWGFRWVQDEIASVSVVKNLYICPSTGIVWNTKIDDLDYNPFKREFGFPLTQRLWHFKSVQGNSCLLYNFLQAPTNLIEIPMPQTAFLSGSIFKFLWGYDCSSLKDHRGFLLKAQPVSKTDIIKSAARYIKKITRIAPLSESTKKFFKTLGALAHLKKAAAYATQP